jgi:hypothetical protein
MYCTNCGGTVSEESRFCGQCGKPVQPITSVRTPLPTSVPIDESMGTHFKILGWLYLVFGALGAVAGVVVFTVLSSLGFGLAHLNVEGLPYGFPHLASGLGLLIAIVLMVLSVPGIIAGYGLLNFRSWARLLTIVLSVLNLIHPPFGTLLGVYGLWVLLSSKGEEYFRNKSALVQP